MRRALFFCCWLSAGSAFAQTANYQARLLGQRALGMGGAFTGIADDPSAAFYNPAALGGLSTTQLEVGLPVLAFNHVRIFDGLVANAPKPRDAVALGLAALPTMLAVTAKLFGSVDDLTAPQLVLGGSIFIPYYNNVAWRQTLQADQTSAFHSVQESEQATYIGGSLALRLNKFSIGASLYYIQNNLSWSNQRSGTLSTCANDICAVDRGYNRNTVLEGWFGAISPRLGLFFQPTERWSFGLMASFSSFKIIGAAGLKTGSYSSSPTGVRDQQFVSNDRIGIDRPQPWELRIGVGHKPQPRLQFSADVSFYLPQQMTVLSNVLASAVVYPVTVKRLFSFNVNVGVEYMIGRYVPLRFGVFTNLSAAPPVKFDRASGQSLFAGTKGCAYVACEPVMHHAGPTSSLGARIWRIQLDFGLYASYGRGFAQQVDPTGVVPYRWSAIDQIQIQFFIGGNLGRVIGETANEIKESIEKKALM